MKLINPLKKIERQVKEVIIINPIKKYEWPIKILIGISGFYANCLQEKKYITLLAAVALPVFVAYQIGRLVKAITKPKRHL